MRRVINVFSLKSTFKYKMNKIQLFNILNTVYEVLYKYINVLIKFKK